MCVTNGTQSRQVQVYDHDTQAKSAAYMQALQAVVGPAKAVSTDFANVLAVLEGDRCVSKSVRGSQKNRQLQHNR